MCVPNDDKPIYPNVDLKSLDIATQAPTNQKSIKVFGYQFNLLSNMSPVPYYYIKMPRFTKKVFSN